jgi:hypothetical protein
MCGLSKLLEGGKQLLSLEISKVTSSNSVCFEITPCQKRLLPFVYLVNSEKTICHPQPPTNHSVFEHREKNMHSMMAPAPQPTTAVSVHFDLPCHPQPAELLEKHHHHTSPCFPLNNPRMAKEPRCLPR